MSKELSKEEVMRRKGIKKYYKDFEVVDAIDLMEEANDEEKALLEKMDDVDISNSIEIVLGDFTGLGMEPTYCTSTIDKVVTIYFDKDCQEDEKDEDTYDREQFIETLFEQLEEDYGE